MLELERELARAKREGEPMTLAFVDVDALKRTNDSLGHRAGDQVLRETARSIRSHLRSYDLIIRYGGDEFLCALVGMTREDAAERFSLVNADLTASRQASVSVGLAELEPEDAVEDLIARADEAMYRERQQQEPSDS
jgi:diguanylate cyclase (GGDEF)-like protein